MHKLDKKILNAVYQKTRLGLLRYPLSESETLFSDRTRIETLIHSGNLVVRKKSITPTLSVAILDVSKDGKAHISVNTEGYVSQKLEQRKIRAKRNQRLLDVDFYKRERNPFMGSKLRRNGGKTICTECHAINKPCEHGETFLRSLPVDARPPRANASKTRWNTFKDLFLRD